MAGEEKLVSAADVQKHATPEDCWIVVDGKVWELTDFAPEHPGGLESITDHAGHDATDVYNAFHAPSLLPTTLGPSKLIGTLDPSTPLPTDPKPPPTSTPHLGTQPSAKPPLNTIISAHDFETVASRTLTPKTWAFYSSAATDCLTRDFNHTAFQRIGFRPRILRDVRRVRTRSRVLGCDVALPVFVSPAAMARMVHPEGEKALARGCVRKGVVQCVSTNASFPIEEIVQEGKGEGYPFFFQLYVDKDRRKSEALLRKVEDLGVVKAVFVTVDAPVPGKREADERVRADESLSAPMSESKAKNDSKGGGLGRIMGGFVDPTLRWEDIEWIRRCTKLPIVLKGIQCAADAKLAMEMGIDGIMLSNHGGRSLDTSPPAILVLLELHKCCPEVFDKMEVYIDGGIRRGTDILKAICLGATAVGLGRPFLYSLAYGQEGVEHLIEILKDEVQTSMRMIGLTNLEQAHPGLVNTLDVDNLIPATENHPYARRRPKARL